MAFSKEDRVLVKELRILKGYSARWFLKAFPMKNWSLSGLNRLLKQIDRTGSAEKKHNGRRRLTRTEANIQAVEQLVLSQESNPGMRRTIREFSRETGISVM